MAPRASAERATWAIFPTEMGTVASGGSGPAISPVGPRVASFGLARVVLIGSPATIVPACSSA
jgi:hypothetical protein